MINIIRKIEACIVQLLEKVYICGDKGVPNAPYVNT